MTKFSLVCVLALFLTISFSNSIKYNSHKLRSIHNYKFNKHNSNLIASSHKLRLKDKARLKQTDCTYFSSLGILELSNLNEASLNCDCYNDLSDQFILALNSLSGLSQDEISGAIDQLQQAKNLMLQIQNYFNPQTSFIQLKERAEQVFDIINNLLPNEEIKLINIKLDQSIDTNKLTSQIVDIINQLINFFQNIDTVETDLENLQSSLQTKCSSNTGSTCDPTNPVKSADYVWDESQNSEGENSCNNSCECDGNRYCSEFGWCVGQAR